MNFNPSMLVLARESQSLTQKQLESKSGIRQNRISRFENGLSIPTDDEMRALASTLKRRGSLFCRTDAPVGLSTSQVYYRRLRSMPASTVKAVEANINLYAMEIEALVRSAELTESRIPVYDIDEYDGDAAGIARRVRTAMQIPSGPIRNLILTIERNGGIVIMYPFGTRKIDAIGQRWPGLPPLFFVNSAIPTDRMRFTLAHELGHIVMHRYPSVDPEREAHAFAAEFLMPESEIRHQLTKPTIASLGQLKPYWRTSVQSLARRAYDLRRLTEWQYKRMCIEMNSLGYSKGEPIVLPAEQPAVIDDLIRMHLQELGYTESELAEATDLPDGEFARKYLPDRNNPIQLRLIDA